MDKSSEFEKVIIILHYDLSMDKYHIYNIANINDDEENAFIKCRWLFSIDKYHIIFFMTNKKRSRMITWNCISCTFNDNPIDFNYGLLIEKTQVEMSMDASVKLYDKYFIPKMWFSYHHDCIILRNPINNSFIAINEKTTQNKITKILEEFSKSDNITEPIFIGYNILFLGENGKNTVVRQLFY